MDGHTVRAVRRAEVCVCRRDLDNFAHECGLPSAFLPLQQARGAAHCAPECASLPAVVCVRPRRSCGNLLRSAITSLRTSCAAMLSSGLTAAQADVQDGATGMPGTPRVQR